MKTKERKLVTVYAPAAQSGFLGNGHTARPVIQVDFRQSDPFILLMDDLLEKDDYTPAGGPHPHGGFETVSLLLEGDLGDGADGLHAGDFEMMTAGRGIVHTEVISHPTRMRLLQLWLNLPKADRRAEPRLQRLRKDAAPIMRAKGVTARVYSGSLAGVTSPVRNYTPLIVADVKLEADSSWLFELPANYTAFIYTLEGIVHVGNEKLSTGRVGWLDRSSTSDLSQLNLRSEEGGARFVIYAALPTGDEIVTHGPFVADTPEDIRQLYADYRAGKMQHITEVDAAQKIVNQTLRL